MSSLFSVVENCDAFTEHCPCWPADIPQSAVDAGVPLDALHRVTVPFDFRLSIRVVMSRGTANIRGGLAIIFNKISYMTWFNTFA